jgi:hypothetical protein
MEALTIEERTDPKAHVVRVKWVCKLMFAYWVWFSAIMAVEMFQLKRSVWSRRWKKLQDSKGQFDATLQSVSDNIQPSSK